MFSDRLSAVGSNVADCNVILSSGIEINIVRTGCRQTDVAEPRIVMHVLCRNSNLVAEHKLSAVDALRDLRAGRDFEELYVRKNGGKRRGIKFGPHRRKVEKHSFHMAIRIVVEQSTGR